LALGGLDKAHPQLEQDLIEQLPLFGGQIATRLFFEHRDDFDELRSRFEIGRTRLVRHGVRQIAEVHGGVTGQREEKRDEADLRTFLIAHDANGTIAPIMTDTAAARFGRLVAIMRTLRSPHGCPWDREQTLSSLRPYVLEETYELLDALDRGDLVALREELGDFLYEAVFLAQIAEEAGHFSIGDAVAGITDKLIRRHPHVFTHDGRPLVDAREDMTSEAVVQKWEELKAGERTTAGTPEKTLLSGVPKTLPALLRAYELSARAAAVGFDWVTPGDVIDKIEEEVAELKAAAREERDPKRVEEELGDALFALTNLARKLGVEPEAALRIANEKFQRRFEGVEKAVTNSGRALKELTLEEMEALWKEEKMLPLEGVEGGILLEGVEGSEGVEEEAKETKGRTE
jgi:MazG family protein